VALDQGRYASRFFMVGNIDKTVQYLSVLFVHPPVAPFLQANRLFLIRSGQLFCFRIEKLSEAMDYCPGSFLDRLHEYPITDMPRWRRKRILNLLANMSEDGIPAFVSFDLDNVALSQLEQFNEELELAMMVENKYEPELDTEG